MNLNMKTWKNLKKGIVVVVALLTAAACTEHNTGPERGNLTISLALDADAAGRIMSDGREDIHAIFISITDKQDNVVEEKKIDVIRFNGTYITESIALPVGDLKITRFLVLDETGEVLFATPQNVSAAARDITGALPLPLKVGAGKSTTLHAEVLSTAGLSPAYFGYSSFELTIINPCDKISAEISDGLWCGRGTFVIAYGNTPPLFELHGSNKQAAFALVTRYTGAGTYDLAGTESSYYRNGDADAYDVVSGSLVITSAPVHSHQRVSGTFNIILRDGNGHTVEIKNGKFNNIRGIGF
jgi:hypothetical protein